MSTEQPKHKRRNFYIGVVVGFILWAIIKELIWPLIAS